MTLRDIVEQYRQNRAFSITPSSGWWTVPVSHLRTLIDVADAACDVSEAEDHTERMRALARLDRAVGGDHE